MENLFWAGEGSTLSDIAGNDMNFFTPNIDYSLRQTNTFRMASIS